MDYLIQQSKLTEINTILFKQKAKITEIVIFRIDEPSMDVYENGLTTSQIIDLMILFSENKFKLNPTIINYSCDISTMRCGKAIISPTEHLSVLSKIKFSKNVDKKRKRTSETFIAEVLLNKTGEKIYKCPICTTVTGTYAAKYPTDTSFFAHREDCPNKNKIPIEA